MTINKKFSNELIRAMFDEKSIEIDDVTAMDRFLYGALIICTYDEIENLFEYFNDHEHYEIGDDEVIDKTINKLLVYYSNIVYQTGVDPYNFTTLNVGKYNMLNKYEIDNLDLKWSTKKDCLANGLIRINDLTPANLILLSPKSQIEIVNKIILYKQKENAQ